MFLTMIENIKKALRNFISFWKKKNYIWNFKQNFIIENNLKRMIPKNYIWRPN